MLPERQALREIPDRLAEVLAIPRDEIQLHDEPGKADLLLGALGHLFLVEYKSRADIATILASIEQLRRYQSLLSQPTRPLLVVPYMGESGREICLRTSIDWMDLSGNAHILAPGLRILLSGAANRYPRRGRPSNALAPKSSRVARSLLLDQPPGAPPRRLLQKEIVEETGLDDGYVSRVVGRLVRDRLLESDEDGRVYAPSPTNLLLAWKAGYDFSKHHLVRGHISAQTSEALQKKVALALASAHIRYAATGLAAAWKYFPYARYRIVSFYVDGVTEGRLDELLGEIGYRPEPRGANLWLLFPVDEGVFHGARDQKGLHCVSPVQTYLDLLHHPERASDAARELATHCLPWAELETGGED